MPQERIQRELEETVRAAGRLTFAGVFQGQVTRLRLIGTFIALLELVKQQVVRVEQAEAFGEIWLTYVPPEERVQAAPLPPEPTPADPRAPEAARPNRKSRPMTNGPRKIPASSCPMSRRLTNRRASSGVAPSDDDPDELDENDEDEYDDEDDDGDEDEDDE